ncbi:hypothetical protein BH09MYX1_BH09MYX1_23100 [soil metagenome]
MHTRSYLLASLFLGSVACGGSIYQPSRVANFDPDCAAEVDDEDVRKAFAAKPQLGAEINVAYFSFDPSKESDVEKAIRVVPGVASVYAIPTLAVTGQHRFEELGVYGAPAPAPFSIKKIRLLAVRGQ